MCASSVCGYQPGIVFRSSSRPSRLLTRGLYPAVALFLFAAVVHVGALMSAVLVLDGCVLVGIGMAVLRNAAGAADELMAYAQEISLSGPAILRPQRWFTRMWGAAATLIGVV